VRPWIIQCVVMLLTTTMPDQPALANGNGALISEGCQHGVSGIGGATCLEGELKQLTERLQRLVEKELHEPSLQRPRTPAGHDQWLQSAMMFCSGIATTEPLPTFEAALLDCYVSVVSDRIATLEDPSPNAIVLAR
jgi:hypothetical protein